MNKLFLYLGIIWLVCFSITSHSQTYQSDFGALSKQNIQWFENNTPLLLRKVPLNLSNLTAEQLSDSSIPDMNEKNEINKTIQQRARYFAAVEQIRIKYVSPPEAAKALNDVSNNLRIKSDEAILKLRDGQINFGQYLAIRNTIIVGAARENSDIEKRYQVSYNSQSSSNTSEAPPQQRPQAPAPQANSSSPNSSSIDENGNKVGACFASIASKIMDRKPITSNMDIFMKKYNPINEKIASLIKGQCKGLSGTSANEPCFRKNLTSFELGFYVGFGSAMGFMNGPQDPQKLPNKEVANALCIGLI